MPWIPRAHSEEQRSHQPQQLTPKHKQAQGVRVWQIGDVLDGKPHNLHVGALGHVVHINRYLVSHPRSLCLPTLESPSLGGGRPQAELSATLGIHQPTEHGESLHGEGRGWHMPQSSRGLCYLLVF